MKSNYKTLGDYILEVKVRNSDMSAKESSLNFTIKYDDLAKTAAITTTPSGTAAITINPTGPETKSAALNRGTSRTSLQAI